MDARHRPKLRLEGGATIAGQKKTVPDYIREFGGITPIDAFRDLGITRLPAVVFNLREEGHDIEKSIETGENRFGNRMRYARYGFGKGETDENQTR